MTSAASSVAGSKTKQKHSKNEGDVNDNNNWNFVLE